MRTTLAALLFAATLVLAGCQAPVSGDPAGPGPDGEGLVAANVTVQNGSLTVDPGLVFVRIESLLETDVEPPERVRVPQRDVSGGTENETGDAVDNETESSGVPLTPFQEAVGLRNDPVDDQLDVAVFGLTSPVGPVVTYPGRNGTVDDERLVVAHEFVHYVQFQNDRSTQLRRAVDTSTTDGQFVVRSVLEGVAVFTTDAYMARYTDNGTRNSPLYDRIAAAYPPGHVGRYGNSQYVEGAEYVASRLDSPGEAERVYENPPQTSEQVIHNLTPEEEPPVGLTASATAPDGWREVGTDRRGEAFVRTVLAVGVSQRRADEAAAGWGNDRLTVYRDTDGDGVGYVWAFAWDSAAEATEFEQALGDYLDARGTREGGVWHLDDGRVARVRAPSPRTAVLVLGEDPFVTRTTVTATAG